MKIINMKTKSQWRTFKLCLHWPKEISKKMTLNWRQSTLNNSFKWFNRRKSKRIFFTPSEQFCHWRNKTNSILWNNLWRTLKYLFKKSSLPFKTDKPHSIRSSNRSKTFWQTAMLPIRNWVQRCTLLDKISSSVKGIKNCRKLPLNWPLKMINKVPDKAWNSLMTS